MSVNGSHHGKLTLSIDWEDFGQLCCRDFLGEIPPPREADIERQTDKILDLLSESGHKATFFVLGMLAKYRPNLVQKIFDLGHEIALHGQNHVAMSKLDRSKAYDDLSDSYKLVTDTIGEPVYGYRAPYFSVNEKNLYVLELLTELGLEYDSSIFPKKMPRYGIEDFNLENRLYRLPNDRSIVELPITLLQSGRRKLPVAGGGYIRIMPNYILRKVYRRLVDSGVDPMVYMHPYEFDTESIDCASAFPEGAKRTAKVFISNMKWNLFRKSIVGKIDYLLKNFEFVTCKEKADDVRSNSECGAVLGSA